MKIQPAIEVPSLKVRLQELYGFQVKRLNFVPEGECSFAYIVDCQDGSRTFLKLWPNQRQALGLRERLPVILPILRELYQRGLFTDLSYPIPTLAGELLSSYGDFGLALFSYEKGQPVGDAESAWSNPSVAAQLARAFARLHQATHQLTSPLPSRSAFDMGFATDFRRGLAALDEIGPRHRPGQIGLRALLLPRRKELLNRLDETERLCEIAQQRESPLVLCHTDMGGGNVLVNSSGKITILDWDELILAPAEHDLQEYRDHNFAEFIRLYIQAGGTSPLDPAQFAFYLQRRYLADITDWMMRILDASNPDEQDSSDLQGIETYCLARLDGFAAEMESITSAIAQAAGSR